MRKVLLLACALLAAAGCAGSEVRVRAANSDARLRVTPAVVTDINTMQLDGIGTSTAKSIQATVTMDDMPAKTRTVFVRDGDRYVAKMHFSMAGTWRVSVALDRPADFIVTLK